MGSIRRRGCRSIGPRAIKEALDLCVCSSECIIPYDTMYLSCVYSVVICARLSPARPSFMPNPGFQLRLFNALCRYFPPLYAMSTATPMPELPKTNEGKRICQVIKVKPEALAEYKKVSTSLGVVFLWPSSSVKLKCRVVPRSSLARGLRGST